ncbi:MAG: THUMP domain-containing protein [Tenuifilum sp.]|uniref:THUMP domain-containing class I SAM-dependent RNA methyltransferase n=2 Tax=Tenuifilum sp. TaxID=2760880 RepID=UPI002B8550F2|nr:THUMP domain-containing protein [Tenuifilum sp.]HQG73346.1 THUMP domain-containing protein [Tenuifilum sp.]HRR11280.1 THUMP domain-containing protein [Tenuifilum sp.]HRS45045.1 THUMP domain-containing protein [Tenuifilum sp.]
MSEKFQMVAKTLQGLEEVLAEELKEIGAENIEVGCRSVSYYGTKETLYKSNFWLRTALRVLKPIYVFNARTIDEFYGNARKFDWTSVMELSHKFAVESVVNSELFPHSRYIALKLKDAIADQFRDRFGKRPFVDPKKPHITFHIHVNNDVCTVSLDSSGESLHRRGYRVAQDVAPINEVLAAGLIKLSGWNGDSVFIDPMCGSGTILIEAALIAYGIAPGIFRQHFGFENWLDFDEQLLQSIYNDDSRERDFEYLILGRDISKQAIASAMENIKESGLNKKIDLGVASIFDYNPPRVDKGIVITNPPYGERLKKEQIENFYKQLSDVFKNKYAGYDVWIISSNQEALRSFGLRPSKKINLLNGALECKYQRFSMYKGSLKSKQS